MTITIKIIVIIMIMIIIELKEIFAVNRIQTHDPRDTSAMLYRLSYEASLEAGQVRVQFIPVI